MRRPRPQRIFRAKERRKAMAVMQTVGKGHRPPLHARLSAGDADYLIELDVADFSASELSVELVGPELTVRGDQLATAEDDGKPFRLHERLRESFRLPDDALADQTRVLYRHGCLEIHVPRTPLRPRVLPIERVSGGLINPDAEGC
jgi:HSP20 family molecular chaperone IbpA